jgi:hypothetical protein
LRNRVSLRTCNRPQLRDSLDRARKLLQGLQNVEANQYRPADVDYGSFGYGNRERGDLSNTNFGIQAVRAAGLDANDEGLAKAIVFLERAAAIGSPSTGFESSQGRALSSDQIPARRSASSSSLQAWQPRSISLTGRASRCRCRPGAS